MSFGSHIRSSTFTLSYPISSAVKYYSAYRARIERFCLYSATWVYYERLSMNHGVLLGGQRRKSFGCAMTEEIERSTRMQGCGMASNVLSIRTN